MLRDATVNRCCIGVELAVFGPPQAVALSESNHAGAGAFHFNIPNLFSLESSI